MLDTIHVFDQRSVDATISLLKGNTIDQFLVCDYNSSHIINSIPNQFILFIPFELSWPLCV